MGNCFTNRMLHHTPTSSTDSLSSGARREELPRPSLLRKFTLPELAAATNNFHPNWMIGEGGFGKVFKGWVDGNDYAPSAPGVGMPVAVKKSNPNSYQGRREWKAEVELLGKFSHPNLVKLLGYCCEGNQFLLVYEYMQRGSLEDHLFARDRGILSWERRIKIAIGVAHGLAFLHSSQNSVIYRDFKTSNILLDEAYNAKLSDFGLARIGPTDGHSHVTTRRIGTHGYAAPEYVATGHLYVKSDVYGFGVVLLELLTGLKAVDFSRSNERQILAEWTKPFLSHKKKVMEIIDPELKDQFPSKGVIRAAHLILNCLQRDPRDRPSIQQVLPALYQTATSQKSNT